MEKSVFYEPHPEVFHNSKWQICMVKHGYYGVDDEYVSDESADAELTEKDIQLFELIDRKNPHAWEKEKAKLQAWWLENNGTRILPVALILTYPEIDENGADVEDTGGRSDLFFYDFHATALHLLGIDHERLTFYHNGIQRRLTDVHGHVVKEVLA